jgi:Lrp/AsnC family leucine-responsive transcriptional regulator
MELDRYDRAILKLLQQDARITNTSLAEKVSLSESACLRRVRTLEEAGGLEAFENAVRKIPEVMECYLMTGDYDYVVRLVVADLADFERIHSQFLTRLPSVARVHSSFAVRTVTRSTAIPVKAPKGN